MSRGSRFLLLAVGIASLAIPLLWPSSSWSSLSPRAAALGWLLAGCLLGLRKDRRLTEILFAAILIPGLYVTLAAHAGMKSLESYALCARVVLALGTQAALCALSPRTWLRSAFTLAVFLAFALGLWNSSLLLSAAVCGLASGVFLLLRSAKARA